MQSCVRLLAFSAVSIYYVAAISTKLAGPYDLEFRCIEHCEDEGNKEFVYNAKLKKVSKYEYAYNGELTMANTTVMSVEATIFKKMNSGLWAKTLDYFYLEACEGLKRHFPIIFKTFTEDYMNVANECPIPAGTYKADNWPIHINEFPLDELEYGEYKIEAVLARDTERIGCLQVYIDVEEKPTGFIHK